MKMSLFVKDNFMSSIEQNPSIIHISLHGFKDHFQIEKPDVSG